MEMLQTAKNQLKKDWAKLEKIYRPGDNLNFKREKVRGIIDSLNKKTRKKKEKYTKRDMKRQQEHKKLEEEYQELEKWGNSFGVLRESARIIKENEISGVQKFNW